LALGRLAETKSLIQSTRDQLEKPAPKAKFEASFTDDPAEIRNNKETTVTRRPDGSIEFTIYALNTSAAQAKNGSVFARICKDCTFAEEPQGFTMAQGGHKYERDKVFANIYGGTGIAVPLSIMPPAGLHEVQVTLIIRCENCEIGPNDILTVKF